jgi:hypothetical protein
LAHFLVPKLSSLFTSSTLSGISGNSSCFTDFPVFSATWKVDVVCQTLSETSVRTQAKAWRVPGPIVNPRHPTFIMALETLKMCPLDVIPILVSTVYQLCPSVAWIPDSLQASPFLLPYPLAQEATPRSSQSVTSALPDILKLC